MANKADADVLRWVGALGHTVAIVVSNPDGSRCLAHELCDKHRALLLARTEYVARNPTVYERRGRRWRKC